MLSTTTYKFPPDALATQQCLWKLTQLGDVSESRESLSLLLTIDPKHSHPHEQGYSPKPSPVCRKVDL